MLYQLSYVREAANHTASRGRWSRARA